MGAAGAPSAPHPSVLLPRPGDGTAGDRAAALGHARASTPADNARHTRTLPSANTAPPTPAADTPSTRHAPPPRPGPWEVTARLNRCSELSPGALLKLLIMIHARDNNNLIIRELRKRH